MFYTYIHRRNDNGKVFYVGKGCGKRAWTASKRNVHWKRVVAAHGMTVEIVAHWPSEAEAFEHEMFLISVFRDMHGKLANMTDGGEGQVGAKRTPEQIEANRTRLIAFYENNPERRAEISRKVKAHIALNQGPAKQKPDTDRTPLWERDGMRDRLIASRRAQFATQEGRNKMAIACGSRPFVCNETGTVFISMNEAARAIGSHVVCVRKVLSGKSKHAAGHTFSYL